MNFTGPISTTSNLTHDCAVDDCRALALLQVLRRAEGEAALYLCTNHYHKLVRRCREKGMTEDDIERLSNLEVKALLSDNEFRETMAKLIADERFRQIIRQRAKVQRKRDRDS